MSCRDGKEAVGGVGGIGDDIGAIARAVVIREALDLTCSPACIV